MVQIWPGLFVCKPGGISPGLIWTTLYIGLQVKYPLSLSDFDETLIFSTTFSKNAQILNFMKIHPMGAKFQADRRTDVQTWRSNKKKGSIFRNFANAPKNLKNQRLKSCISCTCVYTARVCIYCTCVYILHVCIYCTCVYTARVYILHVCIYCTCPRKQLVMIGGYFRA